MRPAPEMAQGEAAASHRPAFSTDVSISFAAQVVIFGLSLITMTVIARTLGPAGKGLYSLAILIPTMAATLASLGINYSTVYLIGKRRHRLGAIVGTTLLSSAGIGVAVALVLLALSPVLTGALLAGAPQRYLLTTLPIIPLLMIFETLYYVVLGHRKMVQLAVFQILRPLVYLALLAGFAWTIGLSVDRAIWSNIVGLLIGVAIAAFVVVRKGYGAGFTFERAVLVDALKFGIKQHVGSVFQLLNYRINVLIVAAWLSPSAVGWYLVAVLVAEACWYLPNALGRILYPKTAASDRDAANQFTPLVCRNALFLTTLAALAIYGTAGAFIPWLLTPQFEPSVMAVKLLLPGIVFFSISKVLGADLSGRGFPQYSTYAAFAALIMTVACDLLLIPRYGMNGAALAGSVAYLTSGCVMLYLFKRTTGTPLRDVLFIRREDGVVYQRLLNVIRRGGHAA